MRRGSRWDGGTGAVDGYTDVPGDAAIDATNDTPAADESDAALGARAEPPGNGLRRGFLLTGSVTLILLAACAASPPTSAGPANAPAAAPRGPGSATDYYLEARLSAGGKGVSHRAKYQSLPTTATFVVPATAPVESVTPSAGQVAYALGNGSDGDAVVVELRWEDGNEETRGT